MRKSYLFCLIFLLLVIALPAEAQKRLWGQSGDPATSVGRNAPDFTLKRLNSEEKVALSSFKGKKPVVLLFTSYT